MRVLMKSLIARLLFYPTLLWNLLMHRLVPARHWWNQIDEHVVLGALPFQHLIPKLKQLGVRGVVNMCGEWRGPIKKYELYDIVQLHLPIADFTAPTLSDIHRGISFIRTNVGSGNVVYLHCKAGRGRSATLALCWLMKSKNMTPEEAQAHILRKRPHVDRALYERPVVRQYQKELGIKNC